MSVTSRFRFLASIVALPITAFQTGFETQGNDNTVSILMIFLVGSALVIVLLLLFLRLIRRYRTQNTSPVIRPVATYSSTPSPDKVEESIDDWQVIPLQYHATIRLHQHQSTFTRTEFRVDKSPFRLGRRKNPSVSTEPDINFLNDREVSRDHVNIEFDHEINRYYITDNSANGTFIGEDSNGKPRKRLKPRESELLDFKAEREIRVQLGKHVVFYIGLEDGAAPSVSAPDLD